MNRGFEILKLGSNNRYNDIYVTTEGFDSALSYLTKHIENSDYKSKFKINTIDGETVMTLDSNKI